MPPIGATVVGSAVDAAHFLIAILAGHIFFIFSRVQIGVEKMQGRKKLPPLGGVFFLYFFPPMRALEINVFFLFFSIFFLRLSFE